MNPFGRSLFMDFIDVFNDTWSFFLLFLSLVTWLLPLIPTLQLPEVSPNELLPMSTHCWCPAQFTGSMIDYTNAICGAAFLQALRGAHEPTNNQSVRAALYDFGHKFTEPEAIDITTALLNNANNTNGENTYIDNEHVYSTYAKTPIILFMFAMCLKLPQFIWLQFSYCFAANLTKTLETLKKDHSDNVKNDDELKVGLLAFSKSNTSNSATFWYIVLKSMRCLIAIVFCVILRSYLQPELEELEISIMDDNRMSLPVADYSDRPLICVIPVRMFQNLQTFSIQCIFKNSEAYNVTEDPRLISLLVYNSLYTLLFVAFIFLTFINIVNLFAWAARLFMRRHRQRVAGSTNLPLDAYLLLYLAQENLGTLAADKLAVHFSNLSSALINKSETQLD